MKSTSGTLTVEYHDESSIEVEAIVSGVAPMKEEEEIKRQFTFHRVKKRWVSLFPRHRRKNSS